jgi:gas vesicle protein
MSNRDGFGAGFWLGTIVGGIVGGVVGASIVGQKTNRLKDESEGGEKRPFKSGRRRQIDRMETARQSLDDKINDLNNTIDAVRSSIGNVAEDAVEDILEPAIQRIDNELKTKSSNG